jgi:5-methylcytosine-specific restriction protein A
VPGVHRSPPYLKLQNFKAVDPAYTGRGMVAGAGPRERAVWQRFTPDPDELHRVADAIKLQARSFTPDDLHESTAEDDEAIAEGRILTATHRRRERRATEKKKAAVLCATGRLACEVCSFDFEKTYGERGRGFAECHHTLPLSTGVRQTRLSDLAIVCSNCHRMIHRRSPLLSLDELRQITTSRQYA